MASPSVTLPDGATWVAARVFYPAGVYRHPPSGLVQLRLVRRGSSYADIDLGVGMRRAFTRPGDLLLSLPDRPTTFGIEDGRELTLLQVLPATATQLIVESGGRGLDDLLPVLRRPVRDPLIAELIRRLESEAEGSTTAQEWAVGVVFANLLRVAATLDAASRPARLPDDVLAGLVARIAADPSEQWSVDRLATAVGMPRRAFAAAFKDAVGMPVHQYLLSLRAEYAAELLRSGDLPLAEVAVRAGFAHQAHMTRTLSRIKGQTPQQIRQRAR